MPIPLKLNENTLKLVRKYTMEFFLVLFILVIGYLSRIIIEGNDEDDKNCRAENIRLNKSLDKKDSIIINITYQLLESQLLLRKVPEVTDSLLRNQTEIPMKKILNDK